MKRENKIRDFISSIGIKKKFVYVMTAVILLFGLTVAVIVKSKMSEDLTTSLLRGGIVITESLASHVEDHVMVEDYVGLKRLVDSMMKKEDNISYVFILDNKNNVLFHTFENGISADLVNANRIKTGQEYSIKLLLTEEGYIRDFAVPMIKGIGAVHMGMSESIIRRTLSRMTWTILFITFFVLILGIFLAYSVVQKMLKPMDMLTKGIGEIGSGNLKYRIDITSKDELGVLAEGFNKMAGDLVVSQNRIIERNIELDNINEELDATNAELIATNEELANLNEELESRVLERTNALKESREKMRAITNSAQEAIIMIDDEGCVSYWNTAAEKIFGYAKKEIMGQEINERLIPEEYLDVFLKSFNGFKKTGKGNIIGHSIDLKAKNKEGKEFPVEISVSSLKLKDRWNAVGVVRDITERKHAEESMKNAFQNQLVFDSILQISLKDTSLDEMLNMSLNILFTIPWLSKVGRGSIFIVEEDTDVLILKAQRGLADEILSACDRVPFGSCHCGTAAQSGELLFVDRLVEDHTITYDGIEPHGHYCVPIIYKGEVIGVINLYIEEGHKYNENEVIFLEAVANTLASFIKRKQAEEARSKLWDQLLQSQKMESIGRLTGGIAHDFNNLLAAMIGYSDLVIKKLPEDDPLREYVGNVVEAGKRATKLVQQMLAFSRKQYLDTKLINLSQLVYDLSKMLKRVIGEDILLKIDTSASTKNVMADETQIEQIILNIVINARHAMPKGGSIIITVDDAEIDSESAKSLHDAVPGEYVRLSVKDTGSGMSKSVKEKIFEPFFTTKDVGKGTGLGLSTVFGIVKQHDGIINVKSEIGYGSEFEIFLPASKEEIEEEEKKKEKIESDKGSETILVVDDEMIVLNMVADTLEVLGYNVLKAQSGEEALKLSTDTDGPIDLLLTDIVMTGMNGWELSQDIKRTRPDIINMFMSGYIEETEIYDDIKKNGMDYFSKPVNSGELVKTIRKRLDERV